MSRRSFLAAGLTGMVVIALVLGLTLHARSLASAPPAQATATIALHPDLAPTNLHAVKDLSAALRSGLAPLDVTITDVPAVQRLYAGALALPTASQQQACQNDIGVVFRLTFVAGADTVSLMTAQASGCLTLVIAGEPLPRAESTAFLTLLAQTLGVSSLI